MDEVVDVGEVAGSAAMLRFRKLRRGQMAHAYRVEESLKLCGREVEGGIWAAKVRDCGKVIDVACRHGSLGVRVTRYVRCRYRDCVLCAHDAAGHIACRVVPRALQGVQAGKTPLWLVVTMPSLGGDSSPSLDELAFDLVWDREADALGAQLVQVKDAVGSLMSGRRQGQGPLSNAVGGTWSIEVVRNYGGWHVHLHWFLLMDGLLDVAKLRAYLLPRLGTRWVRFGRIRGLEGVALDSEQAERVVGGVIREQLKYCVKGAGRLLKTGAYGGRVPLSDDLRRVYAYMGARVIESLSRYRTAGAFGSLRLGGEVERAEREAYKASLGSAGDYDYQRWVYRGEGETYERTKGLSQG